jgi:hypothetical protein
VYRSLLCQIEILNLYPNSEKSLHNAMRTKLEMSVAFHPQTDGWSERTMHTLEDMLRVCMLS